MMMPQLRRVNFLALLLTSVTLLGAAAPAGAQGHLQGDSLFAPFAAVTFGGDTEKKGATFGFSTAYIEESGWGGEFDLSYVTDFNDRDFESTSIATAMINLMVAPKLTWTNWVRPYGIAGLGLISRARLLAAELRHRVQPDRPRHRCGRRRPRPVQRRLRRPRRPALFPLRPDSSGSPPASATARSTSGASRAAAPSPGRRFGHHPSLPLPAQVSVYPLDLTTRSDISLAPSLRLSLISKTRSNSYRVSQSIRRSGWAPPPSPGSNT